MKGYAGVIQEASNVRIDNDTSTAVTSGDFLAMYPQFNSPAVPTAFLEMTLERANASIQEARWFSNRKFAICLFVAHFCTLYLKTAIPAGASPAAVAGKGENKGAVMSKSVDGVSVSYGSSEGAADLTGFGSWKDTVYGEQLATLAQIAGAGMMVVL